MLRDFDKLFEHWRQKPRIFSVNSEEFFIPLDELRKLDPSKTGYPGPRSRLPIPDSFSIRSLETDGIIRETKKRGFKKLVIAYPTSDYYLANSNKISKSNTSDIHFAELGRLRRVPLFYAAKKLFEDAPKEGIEVQFLPMVKLAREFARDKTISSIRLWTSAPPAQDAAYVFFDDILSKGTTLAGMISLLTYYGVPEKNLICPFVYGPMNEFKLNNHQKEIINNLRIEHPDTAARADIILDLVGIGGMESLTRGAAEVLGIPLRGTFFIDSLESNLEDFSDNLHSYEPVPEPDKSYVDRLTKLGFPPVTR